MNRSTRQLVEQARKRGWEFRKLTGTGHVQMCWPGGGMVTFASTPHGNKRSIQNSMADMRRIERTNPLDVDVQLAG